MEKYLGLDDYTALGGKNEFATETEFARYEATARKLIDQHTFGRVSRMSVIPDEVKYLMFDLINKICDYESDENVQSETLDKWSRTYVTRSDDERRRDISRIIGERLNGIVDDSGTPLLYLGVDAT